MAFETDRKYFDVHPYDDSGRFMNEFPRFAKEFLEWWQGWEEWKICDDKMGDPNP